VKGIDEDAYEIDGVWYDVQFSSVSDVIQIEAEPTSVNG